MYMIALLLTQLNSKQILSSSICCFCHNTEMLDVKWFTYAHVSI